MTCPTGWCGAANCLLGTMLVSREGRLLDRHALSHYAPDSRTHGVIERQREIEHLTAEVQAAQDEAAMAHSAVGEAEALASRLQESIASLRRDAQALQARVHAEQVEVLKLNQARMRYEERCGQIDRDLGEIAHGEQAERDRLMRSETELERSREMAELQRGRLDAAESVRGSGTAPCVKPAPSNRHWRGSSRKPATPNASAAASWKTSSATGRWPPSSWHASPMSWSSAANPCWRSTRCRWRRPAGVCRSADGA
jgi:hypothetical protein